jgi:hypothetical protein
MRARRCAGSRGIEARWDAVVTFDGRLWSNLEDYNADSAAILILYEVL